MTRTWDVLDFVNRDVCLDCCYGQHQACTGEIRKRDRETCPCPCQLLKVKT